MTTIIEQDSVGPFFLNRDSPVKENAPHTHQYFPTIQNGLDYLLGHVEPPIWPRTISTYTTERRQVIVYNKAEALARFKQANLLDCRINAYPFYIGWKEVNRQAPDFLFTDLDLSRFKSSREMLDRGLNKTLKNIKEKFKDDRISASVLWSGNGYHIYLPVKAFILELESIFAEFEDPSRQFIQWTEQFLTDNKADPCHSNGLSFRNCMTRVPGSFNSKLAQLNDKGEIVNIAESAEVKIIQKWNGVRPSIKPLLPEFYINLADSKIKEINRHRKRLEKSKHVVNSNDSKTIIPWIEILFQTPISDYRKNTVRLILAPYLINIKKMTYNAAFSIIKNWLNQCDSITRLDFSVDQRIKDILKTVIKVGYVPISFDRLKTENKQLHRLLYEEIDHHRKMRTENLF